MPPPPDPVLTLIGAATWTVIAATIYTWVSAIARLSRGEPLLPPAPPRIVPWRSGSVLATLLLYVAVQVATGLAYALATGSRGTFPPRSQLIVMALANGGILLLVPPLLRLTSGARLADFGIGTGPPARALLRGVAGGLLAAPIVYGILFLATRLWKSRTHPLEEMLRADSSGGIALLAFVSGVLLAPAAEELIFRGVLQGWLVRAFSRGPRKPDPWSVEILLPGPDDGAAEPSPWTAPRAALGETRSDRLARLMPNLITSIVFAALHSGQWPAPVPLFFLSLGLGYLYERTGGVVAPFAMHATFNGLSTAMLYLALLAGKSPPADVPRPAQLACRSVTNFSHEFPLEKPGPGGMILDPSRIHSRRVLEREWMQAPGAADERGTRIGRGASRPIVSR